LVKGYFKPYELGFIVNDLLIANFADVFNVDFTARMEDYLDRIETAELDALTILEQFYHGFTKELDTATQEMLSLKGVGLPTGLRCPKCDKELHIKVGRNDHFLACSGYPDCTYSRDYTRDEKGRIQPIEIEEEELSDKPCKACGRPLVIKQGKYGKFLACSGYPECKHTESLASNNNGKDTGVKCPQENCEGQIVQKTSKRGKVFYGCNRYPECTFALWDKPVDQPCPVCGAPFLIEKSTKRKGTFLTCYHKTCGYEE
jgi:DNA topoisomerase-1